MKTNKKKSSTAKKLMPAFAMLAVSAMTLSSATYAWFSMNTQVTATGMSVKAKAEGGIVISNAANSENWNATAQATHASAELIPTSTKSLNKWFHASSSDANSAAKNSDPYAEIFKTGTGANLSDSTGIGVWTKGANDTSDIYLVNSFFIKSSSDEMTGQTLYVNKVEITNNNNNSANLNKSLRVAINCGDTTKIFAPISGATLTYNVGGTTTATDTGSVTAIEAGTLNTAYGNNFTIPAYTTNSPLEAKIYCYFEGEDPECKSANLTSNLDNIAVSVTFGTTQISS